jgi:hypothetical protein
MFRLVRFQWWPPVEDIGLVLGLLGALGTFPPFFERF